MYGTGSESTNLSAKVRVNHNTIILTESVPYDEPPSWTTTIRLTTCHSDPSKINEVHRFIVALFKGENLHTNLVQLWKELKKQYNAVLQTLLTQEENHQVVLEMHMFSQRGHESYKREISDGRFSRILLILFEEMSEGRIESSETSFVVEVERDESFADNEATPPMSPTSTVISFEEQSLESLASMSESVALGGFADDPYGNVQFQEYHEGSSFITSDITPSTQAVHRQRTEMVETESQTYPVALEGVRPMPLSAKQVQEIKNQLEASLTRRLTDVKNTQEKDKMEIIKRIEKLEKVIKESHQTSELMQASQKAAMDKGLEGTRNSLKDLFEKMDNIERLVEQNMQEVVEARSPQTESEKFQDLTYEIKDLRKDFDRYRGETTEQLESLHRSNTDIKDTLERSRLEVKEMLSQISKSLPTSPYSSPRKAGSHVHLQSSHQYSSSLPTSDSHSHLLKTTEDVQSIDPSDDSDSSSDKTSNDRFPEHNPATQQTINLSNIKQGMQSHSLNLSEQLSVEIPMPTSPVPPSERRPISPALEAAFKHAEQEGFLSDIDIHDKNRSIASSHSTGTSGYTDEYMHGNGQTVPLEPYGTISLSLEETPADLDQSSIIMEVQRSSQIDEGILWEANELRKTNGLPLTADILKIIATAMRDSRTNGSVVSSEGIDTVFCLDLSASTKGKAFDQMISILIDFLNEAEELGIGKNLYENVGIVVFGSRTEIVSPLNTEYSDLVEKICDLKSDGTSPLHTALVLCDIVLKDKGGPMSVGGYIVPPRIVLLSDGRPTDDSQINNPLAEQGTKPAEIGERVKATANQLHHHGYTLFTVPIGSHVNRMFLQDVANIGGGKMINLEDFRTVKKYFHYQVVAGNVIQRCHETGKQKRYAEYLQREVNQADSGLDKDDIIHITEIIHTSKELDDNEYDNLPPLGSRVQILSGEATSEPLQFGTVVLNLPDGWIKVQLDDGLINFYHYGNSDQADVKIVNMSRQLTSDQLIEVGVYVCDKGISDKKGVVFRVTNSGYIDVRWDNGSKSRHKFGADGEFEVEIQAARKYSAVWMWQDTQTQHWINFDSSIQHKIEQAYNKNEKTCLIDIDGERARIVFEKSYMKYMAKDLTIPVRRW